MYQTIFFDLDGTLTDPAEGITGAVAHSLTFFGMERPEQSLLLKFIGPPLYESYARYFGFDPQKTQTAVNRFREYFQSRGIFENRVFPGVEAMLRTLKAHGKTLVLASSKPEAFCNQILEHFHLEDYFDLVSGASFDKTKVRKADILRDALSRLHLPADPASMVMVGDRLHDVEGAGAVGLPCIGVTYGYGSRTELETAGAILTVDTVQQLQQTLLG